MITAAAAVKEKSLSPPEQALHFANGLNGQRDL